MRRLLAPALVLVAASLAAPPAAHADKVIEAQPVWRFDAASYTIDQGERLTFRNTDTPSPGPHDVTAAAPAPEGGPLFRSATIPAGQEAFVEGSQYLTTGSYDFFCSIHTFMTATLVVTDQGTPAPRPAPAAPPEPAAPPAADTRRPSLRVSLQRATVRARRFTAMVTSNEAVSLHLVLTARVRGRTVSVGQATARLDGPGSTAPLRIRPGADGSAGVAPRTARAAAARRPRDRRRRQHGDGQGVADAQALSQTIAEPATWPQARVLVARARRGEGGTAARLRGIAVANGLGQGPRVAGPARGRPLLGARPAHPAPVVALDRAARGGRLALRPAPDEALEPAVVRQELVEADEVDAAPRHRRGGRGRDALDPASRRSRSANVESS